MTFGDLRSILHEPPSARSWDALAAALAALDEREREQALIYAHNALALWPDALRVVPEAHVSSFITDRYHPIYPLARALHVSSPARSQLHALAYCANLKPITLLSLHDVALGEQSGDEELLSAILRHTRLHTLELMYTPLSSGAARALREADTLDALTTLHLERATMSAASAMTLMRAHLPALHTLCVRHNPLGRMGAGSLLRWPSLTSVTSLDLAGCGVEGDLALNAAPLHALTHLDLSYNPLGNIGAYTLRDAPWLPQIESLHLIGCHLSAEGVRALSAAPLTALRTLDVSVNPLTDAGARHLIDSALPTTLRLRADDCLLSTDLRDALAQRFAAP